MVKFELQYLFFTANHQGKKGQKYIYKLIWLGNKKKELERGEGSLHFPIIYHTIPHSITNANDLVHIYKIKETNFLC